jgi:nucleotide-binding universal stress UspA family protein
VYSRILVPLDASELAEQALPHAAELARRFEGELELVTVVHGSREETLEGHDPQSDWDPRALEAQEYVEGVAGRLSQEGLSVHTAVRWGDVAEEIMAHSAESDCDLIVMCTHGRSGLGRWVYGSIADRTLRYARVPVLLVRAAKE